MPQRGWRAVLVATALVAAAMRINNAFRYPPLFGFDAIQNWRYVEHLMQSWALPAPGADWSTAHPPLFYYLAAALARMLAGGQDGTVVAIRLASSAIGLASAGLAAWWIARQDGGASGRSALAFALLLFVPAHVMMSAMLSEEILVASLVTAALVAVALELQAQTGAKAGAGSRSASDARAALAGLCGGLAALTKLSGALVVVAAVIALPLAGLRSGRLDRGLRAALVLGAVSLLAGGWFYLRNLALYGYLYPQSLDAHAVMFVMPPGQRGIVDYLRVSPSLFTDSQVIAPGLLHSVWGGTYASLWFDAHRKFLPLDSVVPSVAAAGTAMLLLALVPTAAFFAGLARGVRRALRERSPIDLLFGLHIVLTLLGYVLFTWRNPWFATVKGSFLLGLGLPVAYYTSDELMRGLARPGPLRGLLAACCLALLLLVIVCFSWGPVFAKQSFAGVLWQPVAPR